MDAAPPAGPGGFVDGHCHLDLDPRPPAEVLARARARGITDVIVAGVDPAGWAAQRDLAAAHPGVHRAAGLHPWAAAERGPALADDLAALHATLAAAPLPVALGELGLDHHACPPATRPAQEAAFRAQLALARERDLPVVLHLVRAHGRALELLRADGLPRAGGVVHGFSGSADVARDYAALGLHLGVGFVILRPGARKLHAAVVALPVERLILETDAPAWPVAGGPSPSEPADLLAMAAAVAALKGLDAEALLQASSATARRLYRLPAAP